MSIPTLAKSLARAVAAFLVVLCASAGGAQERGYPMVTVFGSEVHKGGPQNFDLTQDSRGVLYFGNLAGLLTYDGAWWRLIKLPDDQAAGALAADARGRVVVGAVNELGYVATDGRTEAQYHSLKDRVPPDAREFGDIHAACAVNDGFLFLGEKRLLFWDGNTIRVSAPLTRETSPRRCLPTANGVYLTGRMGLQTIDTASMAIANVGEPRRVSLALDNGNGELVLVVRDVGVFKRAGDVETPFAPEAAQWLKEKMVTGGCRLADGRIVITTRQDGLMILLPDGAIEQVIHDQAGLPDAVLAEALVDREGALWLAMEGPIARIDIASPVSLFDARRGMKGSVSDVVRHDGRLYTATSHGLYAIDEHGTATRVEGFQGAAWRLLSFDGELLIATSRGLYRIRGNGAAELVGPADWEIYDVSRSQADPSRVWLATHNGIASVRKTGGTWQPERILDKHDNVTTVLEHNGSLWCGTVFDGIVRIDAPTSAAPRYTTYGDSEMNVFRVANRLVFIKAAEGEIVSLDASNRLLIDPVLGHFKARGGFFVLVEDARGNVWINSTPPRVYKRSANGHFPEEGEPLVSVTAADIQCLRAAGDGTVWFGSDKGLFRYDPSRVPIALAQPAPLIRRVVGSDNQLLFGGATSPAQQELTYDLRRRMRIEFAPVSYRPGVEYQYRLEPVDTEWSEWTSQPFIDYTNLDAANYAFRLRARGAATSISSEARWTFKVQPPWYRTIYAYVLWVLLAGAAIAAMIMIRTRTLHRQAEHLRARVSEQTVQLREKNELLEQANERLENLSLLDDLTGIANRRYFQTALSDEWNRALRREEPLSLILVDLDYFKELNDRRGHRAGDDCLREVGKFLGETIRRSGEVVARYGGEEFAVLLPGIDAEEAARVAERLRDGIERLDVRYDEHEPRCVTTSCGVATMTPRIGDSTDMLVDLADGALYAAKHAGRNRVSVADDDDASSWITM